MRKKTVTKEDLEKLIMLADSTLDVAQNAPPEMMSERAKEALMGKFSELHYYFVQLTLRALRDRKLAEQLIPIFTEAENYVVTYKKTLNALSDVMRLKHGIPGSLPLPRETRELENRIEAVIRTAPYDEVKSYHEKYRKAAKEEELGRYFEDNIMYL